MVVTFHAFLRSRAQAPRRFSLAATILISVLIHVIIGWYVVSQLISGLPIPEDEPMVVEVTRMEPLPPKPPVITPDEPLPLNPPSIPIHVPDVVRADSIVPPSPLDPAPEAPVVTTGPVVATPAPAGPRAAPAPTVRTSVVYPRRAERLEVEGMATVQIQVGEGGKVQNVTIVSETPDGYRFGEAAADSVWQWEFATAQPGVYRVTVKFKLD